MARTHQDESDTKAIRKDTPESDEPDSAAEGRPDGSESAEGPSIGAETGSPGRDPDKPMNDAQRTYLEPLAESQNEEVATEMSEADAASTIDRLQENAVHVY